MKQMEEEKQQLPHVAILPSLGIGHIIPLAEFAKLLVSRFNFCVTLLLPPTSTHLQSTKEQLSFLDSLPKSISYSFLPPLSQDHIPQDADQDSTISLTHFHSLSSTRAVLVSLAQKVWLVALVTDLFGGDLFDLAREINIPPYLYFTSTAMTLLFAFHLPKLDKIVSCEYKDMSEPLVLPGCIPIQGKDFPEATQNRKNDSYKLVLHHMKQYKQAEGIFINSFLELEPGAIQALQTEDPMRPPVYPIGPIIRSGLGMDEGGSECLMWLDRQPPKSVVFVSFGSAGNLSFKQITELANGLEISGHKFLWVVKSPSDKCSFGSTVDAKCQEDPLEFLPKGFIDRIKDTGLLVPSWAPQIKVLSHRATGGFITHCGWNSVLESIVHEVPLIAWPLYAEQKMNAIMLNKCLRVALRPSTTENGLVQADEIARVVKELMEGEEGNNAYHRMKEISDSAKKAMSENGDSMRLLENVALSWAQGRSL